MFCGIYKAGSNYHLRFIVNAALHAFADRFLEDMVP